MTRGVPHYQTRFVGRRAEAERLVASLRPGFVTVVGTGGVGKTRLVADTLRTRGREALFVDLTTARDLDGMHLALLRDLGAGPGRPGETLAGRSAAELRAAGPEVAVLDNLEHLPADSAEVLAAWQHAAPTTAFVCTSRVAPPFGETLALHPFPVDDDATEAVQLFLRALPLLGTVPVDPDRDRHRIRAVVRRLEGLPLAIELAAARTAVLPLDEIERRLAAPLALLRDVARAEDRTSTLVRSVAWSWETLPTGAATALAQASVFATPFDWDAARAVLSVEGELADHLQILVARHLVRTQEGRFVPYEAVRAYAAEHLVEPGPVHDRHAAWVNGVARRYRRGELGWDALLALAPEVDRVIDRAVADDATSVRRRAGRLVEMNAHAFFLSRWNVEAHLDLTRKLTEPVEGEDADEITFLPTWNSRSERALSLRHLDEAEAGFERVLALSRVHQNRRGVAMALNQLASVACLRGDHTTSAGLASEALGVAREAGDPALSVELMCGVGTFHALYEGRFDEVEASLAPALELARTVGPEAVETVLRRRHGLECHRGRWDEATRWLGELTALYAEMPGVAAFRTYEVQFHAVLSRLCTEGAPAAPSARAWAKAQWADDRNGEPFLVDAWAATLSGDADADEAVAALRARTSRVTDARQATLVDAVAGAASAWRGRCRPRSGPPATDGAAAAVVRVSLLFDELARGDLTAAEALRRAEAEGPVSLWAFALRRGLVDRAAAEAHEASTWHVASDGAWFRDPAGDTHGLGGRPTLARLAVALAADRGRGLVVDEMFAAGWPGERATPAARSNRVRVAVTTLRRLGLAPLQWERGRGWYLDAPVRLASSDPVDAG
ncbi:MAG: AAA family ATPase [Alphaproteobacteria bacterium]|nr:AAA family ATPase [Alphaproteobacteria bacterium]